MAQRVILELSGSDAQRFLQDLVTNDIGTTEGQLVYTALLSPQGKYLFDFFVCKDGERWLIDVAADRAAALAQRLTMYRLRADVAIAQSTLAVSRGTGAPPKGALADPRHPELGWRHYGADEADDGTDWDAVRVAQCVPETGIELIPDQSYILECGFDRLNGVDFRKGCYVGQEVTARMRHKTELRKGLRRVALSGAVPIGTEITTSGKTVGQVFTQSGSAAIAYLRFDRAQPVMQAGGVEVRLISEPKN